MTGGQRLSLRTWAARSLYLSTALLSVSSARAQVTYPSTFQITDRDAPGQIAVRLQDYAIAPNSQISQTSGDKTATQVARINFMRQDPTNANRFVVPDLNGSLYTLDKTTKQFSSYINFPSIFSNFDNNAGFAAGLVTVQFDPGFADPTSPGYGEFYTTHTEVAPGQNPATADFRIGVLTEWKVPGDPVANFGNPNAAPSHREMLEVNYTSNVHPLGDIAFNPNAHPGDADYRMMYVSGGDGAAGESGSAATRNMDQRLDNYLGKVLRIQPNPVTALTPYSIPTDNPYASSTFTDAGAKGEIWAYGFRNPHRLYFDQPSGKLIVDDIGLNSYEEVDIVHKGANYGYSKIEGNQVLSSSGSTQNQVTSATLPTTLPVWVSSTTSAFNGLTIQPTYPVAEFSHRDGDAITSGFVYRGTKIPSLVGKYVFGDIPNGRLFYVDYAQLLAQEAKNGGFGDPLSMPQVHEMQVMYSGSQIRVFDLVRDTFDLRNETPNGSTSFTGIDDNDRLPGDATSTDTVDPYGVDYRQTGQAIGGRADIRLAMGPDNELYLISKSDGMIRQLLNAGDYNGLPGDFNFDVKVTNADIQSMLDA